MASVATMGGLHAANYEARASGSILVNLDDVGSLVHQDWHEDLLLYSSIGCMCPTAVFGLQPCLRRPGLFD